ncbi:MAG TPA: nucleotidyltransferase domain-containing protein [Candidatus Acetothermia bacterium]|nr:nucleotidyltransferase domain-containing protein [Candidatus Acetothermia bacterium]
MFRGYPGIRAVYLFGSAASGHAHPDGDIDLAVIPADTSVKLGINCPAASGRGSLL